MGGGRANGGSRNVSKSTTPPRRRRACRPRGRRRLGPAAPRPGARARRALAAGGARGRSPGARSGAQVARGWVVQCAAAPAAAYLGAGRAARWVSWCLAYSAPRARPRHGALPAPRCRRAPQPAREERGAPVLRRAAPTPAGATRALASLSSLALGRPRLSRPAKPQAVPQERAAARAYGQQAPGVRPAAARSGMKQRTGA